jgi:diguanylate cyclase (GGDEF)-like protein
MKESPEELSKRVGELEKEVERLRHDLIHDPLTGLKTRKFFEEETKMYLAAILRSERSGRKETFGYKSLTLVFFDVDHFKSVNDTYGHATGDMVLTAVAQRINQCFREGDTVARWGGEEFVVALLGANEQDAYKKADEVREKISQMFYEFDPNFRITISAGVAQAEKDVAYETVLERADKALYHAKETGRNKVVAYSELPLDN